MLKITEAARAELKRIFDERELPPGRYLRLAVPPLWHEHGDFGIVLDQEEHGDHAFAVNGAKVLLVDDQLTERLSKSVFDFQDGRGFTLDVF